MQNDPSLALSSIGSRYVGDRSKLFSNLQGNRVAQLLAIEEFSVANVLLKPRALGYLTAGTIGAFCQSADELISRKHVRLSGKLLHLPPEHKVEFEQHLAQLACRLWGRMQQPEDAAPLGHDGYLKLWSLESPWLEYDFILLDEAQDTNEAVLSVLRKQQAQLTLVGDRHQQIYEWRGAVNAMAKVRTAAESSLTQSFRYGPEIAAVATRILRDLGETNTLRGNPAIKSEIATTGRTRAVLCRTNAGVIAVVLETLLREQKPHVVGGVADLTRMLEDVTRLKQGTPAESAELFGFGNWDEVVAFADAEEGQSLRPFVILVHTNGEDRLMRALQSVASSEDAADLVVSTGHKAKGREWPTVRLHSDFEPTKLRQHQTGKPSINQEETRLLYVASTRAQSLLVVPAPIAASWGMSVATSPAPTRQGVPGAGHAASAATVAARVPEAHAGLPAVTKALARAAPGEAIAVSTPAMEPMGLVIKPGKVPAAIAPPTAPGLPIQPPAAARQGFFASLIKSVFGQR